MKKTSIIALILVVLSSCVKEEPATKETKTPESAYIPGAMVVKFTEEMADAMEAAQGGLETKSATLNTVFQDYGVIRYTRVFDSDPRWVERERREGMHLWYRLEMDPAISMTKAAVDLAAVPGVISARPERKIKLHYTTTPNDTKFSIEWHLTSSTAGLNVQNIWTEFTQGDPKVIVNVVDGGIDPSHEDLQYNVIPGGSNGGSKNFVNNSYKITGHFHGTHVAGTIAATTNNGKGVAGIAGGDYAAGKKGVRLLCSQVFTDNSSASSSNFANAIKYGADNGAVISQNSWGYDYDTNGNGTISASELAAAANDYIDADTKAGVDYFIKYAGCDNQGNQLPDSPMKGGIVFFAAGNDNIQYGWPANYEPIVAVGATTSGKKKASFSNYGDWVDLCAPGQSIYNTACGEYGTYSYMSGTSMACPMVSGVAALILSYRGGPGFTNEFLKECLLEGAHDDLASSKIGKRVDAYASMLYQLDVENDPPVITPKFDPSDAMIKGSATVSLSFAVVDPEGRPVTTTVAKGSQAESWSELSDGVITVTITASAVQAGTYTSTITATDNFGAQAVYHFEYTILPNAAPVVAQKISNIVANVGDPAFRVSLAGGFSDPDGDVLTYEIKSSSNEIVGGRVYEDEVAITIGKKTGEAILTIKAKDGCGAEAMQEIVVFVRKENEKISLWPTKVEDVLYVGKGAEKEETSVKVYNRTGAFVAGAVGVASVFTPMEVDLSDLVPGVYCVKVEVSGEEYVKTIVKL